MSFKLFIYYCAVCGGWAAAFGWVFGQVMAPSPDKSLIMRAIVLGSFLGMFVALGLGLLDGLWNLSAHQMVKVVIQSIVIAGIGCLGGLVGGMIGQGMYSSMGEAGRVLGWTL